MCDTSFTHLEVADVHCRTGLHCDVCWGVGAVGVGEGASSVKVC